MAKAEIKLENFNTKTDEGDFNLYIDDKLVGEDCVFSGRNKEGDFEFYNAYSWGWLTHRLFDHQPTEMQISWDGHVRAILDTKSIQILTKSSYSLTACIIDIELKEVTLDPHEQFIASMSLDEKKAFVLTKLVESKSLTRQDLNHFRKILKG